MDLTTSRHTLEGFFNAFGNEQNIAQALLCFAPEAILFDLGNGAAARGREQLDHLLSRHAGKRVTHVTILEEDHPCGCCDRVYGRAVLADGQSSYPFCAFFVHTGEQQLIAALHLAMEKQQSNAVAMENRLRVSEEELRLAMAQMGKVVGVFDAAARTLTLPENYARKYGIPPVLEGIPYSMKERSIFTGESLTAYIQLYEALLAGEKSGVMECSLRRANGSLRWERIGFASIFGPEGQPVKAVISIEDTTLQHQREDESAALRKNERMLRMMAAHSDRVFYHYDPATHTTFADPGSAQKPENVLEGSGMPEGLIASGRVLPESIEDLRRVFAEMDEGQPEGNARVHLLWADNKPHWMDLRFSLLPSEETRPASAVISVLDITQDHERELAYKRYWQKLRSGAQKESLVYFETDLTTGLVETYSCDIPGVTLPECGCTHETVTEYGVGSFVLPGLREQARSFFSRQRLLTEFAQGADVFTADWQLQLPSGQRRWFRAEVQLIRDPYTDHVKAYTILRDVTGEKLAALTVKKQAEIDGLTGVYNKTTAETLIRQWLKNSPGQACALLIVDLDRLKAINDHLGHSLGDQAIHMIAQTLRGQFRKTDIVGRVGGDEFVVFLEQAGNAAKLHSQMAALIRRISALRFGENNNIPLSGSIGVATGVAGADSFESLFQHADKALYHVKRNGKNGYAFYTPEMERAAYRCPVSQTPSLWQTDPFSRVELDQLLFAVSALYPLMLSVNLTQDSYYAIQYQHFPTNASYDTGIFSHLIANGARSFHPEDRSGFLRAFSREELLAAHQRGESAVTYTGRQRGDDGVYRCIRTDVVFTPEHHGDVMEITLAREVPPSQPAL